MKIDIVVLAALLVPLLTAGPVPAAAPDSGAPCPEGATRTDRGCLVNPRNTHKVKPEYPHKALTHHVEGSVTLKAVVTVEGKVEHIIVLNAQATDVSYLDSLKEAAVKAMAKWRYTPGTIDGKPVPIYFTDTIDFTLAHR